MKSTATAVSATLVALATFVPSIAEAADFTVDFTNLRGISTTARSFTDGPVTLTFGPSAFSPQNSTVAGGPFVASSARGVCLFANSQDAVTRCGVNGTVTTDPNEYNNIVMTSNIDIVFKGGSVGRSLGPVNPVEITKSTPGVLGTIPTTEGSFTLSPFGLTAGESLFFIGSGGDNSSLRVSSFTVSTSSPTAEVPGPLPLLGAATAFGFSRKLRKRIALTS
jgi:hypothetical protein